MNVWGVGVTEREVWAIKKDRKRGREKGEGGEWE